MTPDQDDGWFNDSGSVELEVSDTDALVLDPGGLDEMDAELDAAFQPIATPLPAAPQRSLSALACPACNGPVDVKSRHVAVFGGAVRVYCSATCLEQRDARPAEAQTASIALPPKRRHIWWAAFGGFAAAACVTGFYLTRELREMREAPLIPPSPNVAAQGPADPEPSAVNDPQKEADAALTQELMHDAWIHPLAGPTRRMPHNHNGAFGAERAGERPPECVSGHCGVDVGNVWGEHVYAVHDGVIDFVNRGPNEERGGAFVRIAHRDGTLFSWYFHLAAIPRSIRPGVKVAAGTVVGLLGDTGVKHSAPHLHFSLSVKTSKHQRERYLDPEPLIALWPLWLPNENRVGGTISNAEEPGLPVRASGGSRKSKKRDKAVTETTVAAPAPASSVGGGGADIAPAAPSAPAADGSTGTNN